MTSAERIAYLSMLGKQVATILTNSVGALAPAWEFVTPSEDAYNVYMVNRGTGARIYLSLECSKGYQVYDRVSVSGHMHNGTGWKCVSAPRITIARSKNPEAIAKDIAKRFLPEYLRVYALAQAKVQADADYDAAITANLQRLAKVAGVTVGTEGRGYGEVNKSFNFRVGKHQYHSVTVSDHDVYLKLYNLTFEQAEVIIKYLRGK